MSSPVILAYHQVWKGAPGDSDPVYATSTDKLYAQLRWLKFADIPVIDPSSYLRNKNQQGVVLTFDDGFESDHEHVGALLTEFGYKAIFFPGIHNIPEDSDRWRYYKTMAEDGHIIGSHGVTHANLTELSGPQLMRELKCSKGIIEKHVGQPCSVFSFPGGRYNNQVIKAALNLGYTHLFGCSAGKLFRNDHLSERWNIRQSVCLDDFKLIVQQDFKTVQKERLAHITRSAIQAVFSDETSTRLAYNLGL